MDVLLARPRLVVAVVLIASGAFGGLAARRVAVDNTIGVWLPIGDEDLARYESFREVFGEDRFVVVGALEDGPVDRAAELEDLPEVDRVVGPVVGEGVTVHLVFPAPDLDAAAMARFHEGLEDHAAGRDLLLAGPEAINRALDVGSQASFGTLFPVVVALIGIVLWGALRDGRLVAGVLAVSGLATVWTVGAMALAGRPINMVTSTLPALLVVLGTAYSLHLSAAFQAATGRDAAARWRRARDETLRPCALTALTTAAGLSSLALADLPPVADLGLFGALGVLVGFALVFAFLPAYALVVGVASARPIAIGRSSSPAAALRRLRLPILVAAALVTVGAGLGARRLVVESHILSFFHPDHPVVVATGRIEDRAIGLTPIEIWFRGPVERFLSPEATASARDLAAALARLPDVTGVHGPLVEGGPVPPPLLLRAAPPDRLRLAGGRVDVRWTLSVRTISIEASQALLGQVERQLRLRRPAGVEVAVTGAIPILVRVQALLLSTQIKTFGASMVVVTLFLVVAFRSLRLALLSLVPNVLPIAITVGAMGWLGIPLDVATVTVAAIALGLVVDDTIHFLDRYARTTGSAVDRVDQVLAATGRPIVFTSIGLAVGFSAFGVAPFRPTMYFGLLIAATALLALAFDLVVLPALLLLGPLEAEAEVAPA